MPPKNIFVFNTVVAKLIFLLNIPIQHIFRYKSV